MRIASQAANPGEIFRAGAGKQWDAQVVAAFFAARDDVRAISGSERANLTLDVQQWTGIGTAGVSVGNASPGGDRDRPRAHQERSLIWLSSTCAASRKSSSPEARARSRARSASARA